MSGRIKQPVYVYSHEGKYIEMFYNTDASRKKYFPNDLFKRPIFNWWANHLKLGKVEYFINDNIIALKDRIGKDNIIQVIAIHNSPFCKKSDEYKPVEVFNLQFEKIAEFKNQRLLLKMMPHVSQATLSKHLTRDKPKKVINQNGLFLVLKNKVYELHNN